MKILRRMLTSILFILVTVWLLLVVLMYAFQDRFIYYPQKLLSSTPADIALPYEDIFLTTADGLKIHGWYIKHPEPLATLLFLHGNAGNISHRLDSLQIFHALGLSVLIIDYRGYGRSQGHPSEQGTYLDAQAAWDFLVSSQHIAAQNIIIFGRSLGAAVAVQLAEQQTAGALIMESAFTSIVEIGKRYYPYLPVQWLTRIRYPSIERVSNINCPLLVIHSPDDELIPFELGEQLFASARHPKSFLKTRGGHNDGFLLTGETYINGLRSFLNEHLSP